MARLRELFLEGDISRDEYHQRRNVMQAEQDTPPSIAVTTDDQIELLWTSVEDAEARFHYAGPLD